MLRASIDSIARRSNSMDNIYSSEYTGYVYIWYDTISKFYYVGGHHGRVEDSYVCSNRPMKRAYNLRPNTFKFRVLEYINNGKLELRQAEQRWLNLIKDHELMISENVRNDTCRYYNVKKTANGGSHKGHKKNRTKPAWCKGHNKEEMNLRRAGLLCFMSDKPNVKSTTRKPKMSSAWNKGLKKLKQNLTYTCEACKCEFESIKHRKTCSLSCAGKMSWIKGSAVPGFKKNQIAWNKGLPNTTSAENGRKSASKLSATVKGRKLATRDNGSRYWIYPNENGEIV